MRIHKAPSSPAPAVGQLWDYVEEFKFMNITGQSFTVMDVTDNVVYYTHDQLIYRDGAFHNPTVIRQVGGITQFVSEPFTFKRGYPSKPLLFQLIFRNSEWICFRKIFIVFLN